VSDRERPVFTGVNGTLMARRSWPDRHRSPVACSSPVDAGCDISLSLDEHAAGMALSSRTTGGPGRLAIGPASFGCSWLPELAAVRGRCCTFVLYCRALLPGRMPSSMVALTRGLNYLSALPVAPIPAGTSSLPDTLSAPLTRHAWCGSACLGSMAGGLFRLRLSQLVGSSTLTVPPG
jgi:hypothetical protein